MECCTHFEPIGDVANCRIGEQINGCGPDCEAYLPDKERQPCEVWTRVMGYHRPTSAFNKGKLAEHNGRKHFRES